MRPVKRGSFGAAVLTVAGSDSGGGAGIQADLKAFNALGCFGTCAITCLTAQNPDGVDAVVATSGRMVSRQIASVCSYFKVSAAKTGMLYSSEIVKAVASSFEKCGIRNLVVDPVMIATSGARLLRSSAVKTMCSELFPQARVITPNLDEAAVLYGETISSVAEMEKAAERIARRYGVACVVKGGHLLKGSGADEVVDVLFDGMAMHRFSSRRIKGVKTHGTGCSFSAALTANLARGRNLPEAVANAKRYVAKLLR